MSRRLSILPEEAEEYSSPSPSPRLRKTAPPTELDKLLSQSATDNQESDRKCVNGSLKLLSTEMSGQAANNGTASLVDAQSIPIQSTIKDEMTITDESALTDDTFEKTGIGTKSLRQIDRPNNLQLIPNCPSPTNQLNENIEYNDKPKLLQKSESNLYSKFEIARDFLEPIGGGLFSSMLSTLSRSNEGSPDGSSSPLLSPASITSQVLALKSPVSPFTSSPSPRLSLVLETRATGSHRSFQKEEESSFTWGSVSLPHCLESSITSVPDRPSDSQGCFDLSNSVIHNLSSSLSSWTNDSSNLSGSALVPEDSIIAARRLEHFRCVARSPTLPVDSGYSDDMSTSAADVLQSTVSTQFSLDEDSKPLITIDKGSNDILFKSATSSSNSLFSNLPGVPLSQCRPLQLSKSYSKLVNQSSDEDKSGPDLSGGSIPLHLRGENGKEPRRDSLTLPTAAWALFRRRTSSGTTEPSPMNSPVYYTPPDTSPWSSPRMSLDLEDGINLEVCNSSTTITPYQTPRPSFSLDRSPLAHHGSSYLSLSESNVRSRSKSSSPFLTPRSGSICSSSQEINDVSDPTSQDGGGRNSATVTPFITPQPSPDADMGWDTTFGSIE